MLREMPDVFSKARSSRLLDVPQGGLALTDCFRSSFVWTPQLVAPAFTNCKQPERASKTKLLRLEQECELASTTLTGIHPPAFCQLLYVHTAAATDLPSAKLAWIAEKYFKQSPRPIRIWWPTRKFAKRYGRWTGRDQLSTKHRAAISHELLVSATWVSLFLRSPEQALSRWQSEKHVEFDAHRDRQNGTIPDGIITESESEPVAVEVLGRYPKPFIEKKLRGLQERFSRVEVWGLKV